MRSTRIMLLAVALLAVSTAALAVAEEAGDFHRRALLKTMKSSNRKPILMLVLLMIAVWGWTLNVIGTGTRAGDHTLTATCKVESL